MKTKGEVLKIEIEKLITYDNGFSCKYALVIIDGETKLDRYCFAYKELSYHKMPYIEEVQKKLPSTIYMQSEWGRKMFPKFSKEDEILLLDNFDDFYHIYLSQNNLILDQNGKPLSTCVQLDNHILYSTYSYGGKKAYEVGKQRIVEYYEKIKEKTIWAELIKEDDGTPYCINFLLNDEDFEELIISQGNRIHEREAMYVLKNMFADKYNIK